MKTLFIITTAFLFLVVCPSNHAASSTNTPSVSDSESQSPAFSADTKARLKKIQQDYGVVVMVNDHLITIGSNGYISEAKANQVKSALHTVYGSGFTNYAVTFIVK